MVLVKKKLTYPNEFTREAAESSKEDSIPRTTSSLDLDF
jgi:hypothetical protein